MAKCPKCDREVLFISEKTDVDLIFIVKCPVCNTAIGAITDFTDKLEDIRQQLDDIKRHVDPSRS